MTTKENKKLVKPLSFILAAVVVIVLLVTFIPRDGGGDPENCALCSYGNHKQYHAPILVNLATGEMGELRVYDPAPEKPFYEISEIQHTGTFDVGTCLDFTYTRDTFLQSVEIKITNEKLKKPSRELYCEDCRDLLNDLTDRRYIIADFYQEDSFDVFPLVDDASYTMRDYEIAIAKSSDKTMFDILVTGHVEGLTFVD